MTETREDEVALNRAKHGGRTAKRKVETAPAPPRIPRITRLMALAIKFQDMADRGEIRDCAGLARLGLVTRARLTQIMNLLLLAPDIQDEILRLGAAADQKIVVERHVRPVVKFVHWEHQRRACSSRPAGRRAHGHHRARPDDDGSPRGFHVRGSDESMSVQTLTDPASPQAGRLERRVG